jgi:hypothetical protein
MTKDPLYAFAVGALFALGAAFAGWQAGLGIYSAIYESFRDSGREVALESKRILEIFRYCGWFLGAGLGAFAFIRWHRCGALDPSGQRLSVKRVVVLALSGAGATHLGYLLINGASVEAMVLTCFAFLIGGSALAAGFFGMQPPRFFAGRFIVAALASFVTLWAALAFDKGIAQRYDSVERNRDVYTEMTGDRTLVVTMPDRPEIAIKLPFSRNPAPMHDYSPWINLDGGLSYRYRVN